MTLWLRSTLVDVGAIKTKWPARSLQLVSFCLELEVLQTQINIAGMFQYQVPSGDSETDEVKLVGTFTPDTF